MNKATFDDEFNVFGAPKSAPGSSLIRWYILLGLLLPFTALTYLAVSSGSPSDRGGRPVALTTILTITGPFVGAIARRGQPCCRSCSLAIAAYSGPVLAIGLLAQVVPLPFRRGGQTVRLVLWTLGWLTWLASGPISFMHALS